MFFTNGVFRKIVVILMSTSLIILGLYLGYGYFINVFYENAFPVEDYKHDDGKYSYVQLSSPKKTLCTLCIKKRELIDINQNLYSTRTMQTDILFDGRDIRDISWGVDSYDLFFCSKEQGVFVYTFDDEEWIGKLYLDVEHTKRAVEYGIMDSYFFTGEISNKKSKDFNSPKKTTIEIFVKTIPKEILKRIENQMGRTQ